MNEGPMDAPEDLPPVDAAALRQAATAIAALRELNEQPLSHPVRVTVALLLEQVAEEIRGS